MTEKQKATAPPTARRSAHGEGTITEQTRLSDGRWLIRWRVAGTTPSGTRERRNGTTRGTLADARRAIRDARLNIERTIPATEAQNLTVGLLLSDFIAQKAGHIRPKTLKEYEALARLHLTPRLGGKAVSGLTAAQIQAFHRELVETTSLGRTRQLIHQLLSQALDHAVILGVLTHNPAKSVKVPPAPPPRRVRMEESGDVLAFSPELADHLFRLALEEDSPHAHAAALGLALGMRRGEVYGLTWDAVNLKPRPDAPHGLLEVRQSLSGGKVDTLGPVKTRRSRRTLRLNEKAAAALKAARTWQGRQDRATFTASGFVFTDPTGRPERPARGRDALNRLQRRLWAEQRIRSGSGPATTEDPDPEYLHWHSLRATFVSCAYLAGASIDDISKVCGHSSTFVTETIYRRTFDKAAPLVRYHSAPESRTDAAIRERRELFSEG